MLAADELVKLLISYETEQVPALEDTDTVSGVSIKIVPVCFPVKVWAASVLAMVAVVVGKFMVVESVPARVRELLTVRFLELATPVPPCAGGNGDERCVDVT